MHALGRALRQVAAMVAEDWSSPATGDQAIRATRERLGLEVEWPADVLADQMCHLARCGSIRPEFTPLDERLMGAWSF